MKHIALLFITILSIFNFTSTYAKQIKDKLENLEKTFDGKIGVYAINTNNQQIISYRASERFPIQSTFKLIGASALLKASVKNKKLLQEKVHYTQNDLIFWSPITEQHVADGMTFMKLAEAAMSYSDNLAIDLIIRKLGGPQTVTNFARSIGNTSFTISHYEKEGLNSNPQDLHDTSTPQDMAISVQKLILGNVLPMFQREQLVTWMKNNTTGDTRIRAGAPASWVVAEKTGSGDYGIVNDIGILWSSACKPIVLAIYTVQNNKNAKKRDDIVASTTSLILDEFAKNSKCFKAL